VKLVIYGVTRNTTLLLSVPLGVVTSTVPVVAPVGTVAVISELDATLKVAALPLKVTLVAPVRSVPRIFTAAPTVPEVGSVSTNEPRPADRLKTVPQPPAQALLRSRRGNRLPSRSGKASSACRLG
jgi:hypothetical protein